VKSAAVLEKILGFTPDRINSSHSKRLGAVMRSLGWTGPVNMRFGVEQGKGYWKAV
jgi:hypothetical protein